MPQFTLFSLEVHPFRSIARPTRKGLIPLIMPNML
jgi:hypothetical protein